MPCMMLVCLTKTKAECTMFARLVLFKREFIYYEKCARRFGDDSYGRYRELAFILGSLSLLLGLSELIDMGRSVIILNHLIKLKKCTFYSHPNI